MREDHGSRTEHDAALWEAHRGQADDPDDRPTLAEATRDAADGDWRFAPHAPGEACEEWAGVDDAPDGPEKIWECVECGRTHRQGDAVATKKVNQWLVQREAVRLAQAAEHPDLIDAKGRRWTWKRGDLYRHERMACPRDLLLEPVVEVSR